MAKKQIAREYHVPNIGGVEIIHAPGFVNGPFYANLYNYGVSAEKSESEDEVRVRVGKTITELLELQRKLLEDKLSSIQSVLSDIQTSETPLGALSKYETPE